MEKKKILITKDVLRADYLPIYGNKYWQMPEFNELAEKGTVFRKHYTSAPSSAMSYTSMFSGLYPHELNRKTYSEVNQFDQCPTLFDILQGLGYSCHIVWDEAWFKIPYSHSKVYGDTRTKFHNIKIAQKVGSLKINTEKLTPKDQDRTIQLILKVVDNILNENKIFIWIHLPHAILGTTGWGSDIDLFDRLIGLLRKRFNDNSIYISADHGNMNCEKGVPSYGSHVYEGAIRIPLITPQIGNFNEINFPTSNTMLKEIIINGTVPQEKYIYSDSRYYLQGNRKLAIIKANYKYIYNTHGKQEELYDLEFDPNENVNLLVNSIYDKNRFCIYKLDEVYYYPFWDQVEEIFVELRNEKNRIWKDANCFINILYSLNKVRRNGIYNYIKLNIMKDFGKGRFNSKAKVQIYQP